MTEVRHLRLGVNIDHVATIRNARGGAHPDPLRAAEIAAAAGADGITAHLREDRRHIGDGDIERLMDEIALPLNLEMAATEEMQAIALRHRPHAACIVPERREERTTEGGIDAAGQHNRLAPIVAALAEVGIRVSLFVEPDRRQLDAAIGLGAPVVELHTGAYCEAVSAGYGQAEELRKNRHRCTPWRRIGTRGPRRSRDLVRNGDGNCPDSRTGRTQYRTLPRRRGDLCRPGREHRDDASPYARGA